MTNLNIRDFPPEVLKALKLEALKRDLSLREFVIEQLAKALETKKK